MAGECGFDHAIQRLFKSRDFVAQQQLGHELIQGAALTSMSEVPFEMRFKCHSCGIVMWFENVAWHTGGVGWRLAEESLRYAATRCKARKVIVSGRAGMWPFLPP